MPKHPPPERIKAPQVAAITGLSLRTVQMMAAAGKIPSAAQLGRTWTFDELVVRRWLKEQETPACNEMRPTQTPTSTELATHGILRSRSEDSKYASLYE